MSNLKLLPIYRVSSDAQAGTSGEGLDRQRASAVSVARAHDAILLPPVEIINVSGSDLDATSEWRDEVLPLVADPQTHIVTDAIDRVLRAEEFNFRVMQDLLSSGTHIYTPGKVHDLEDPEDGFLAGLFALLGGREKAEIKRRMMAGREAARRRGEWPFKDAALPRGTTFDRTSKTWGYDGPEAEIIKSVYHDFVVRRQAMRAIGRTVGKPMQTIRGYLENHIYKGILRYDEKRGAKYRSKNGRQPDRKKIPRAPHEVIEVRVFGGADQEPQLVSDGQWEDAQRLLQANSKNFLRRRAEGRPETWASGFMVSALAPEGRAREDGFIDLTMEDVNKHHVYSNGGPLGMRRYSCACGRIQSSLPMCGLRGPRAAGVNQTLDAYLVALTSEEWFVEAVRAPVSEKGGGACVQRTMIESRLKDIEARDERLTEMRLDGRIARSRHAQEQDKLQQEQELLRRKLRRLAGEADLPEDADLARLQQDWSWDPTWSHERKREWLGRYVHRIGLSNEGVEYVVVRIPCADGAMPLYGCGHRQDWLVPVFARAAPKRNCVA